MKTDETAICVATGKVTANAKEICRALAGQGISTLVVHKETAPANLPEYREYSAPADNQHWSGKPGEDLFFNGWKLLF